jgi:hypothetical protein
VAATGCGAGVSDFTAAGSSDAADFVGDAFVAAGFVGEAVAGFVTAGFLGDAFGATTDATGREGAGACAVSRAEARRQTPSVQM